MKLFSLLFTLVVSLYAETSPVPVTLQLQWKHQFQFAGYYMAKEKGFYKDAGLDVTMQEFQDGIDIVSEVTSGKVAFATGRSSLILHRDDDILLLAAIFQSSPFVLQSLRRNDIKTLKDIKGKKVYVTHVIADMAPIAAMLRAEGITQYDFQLVHHTFTPDDLISGKADFISAYLSNEPFVLKEKGYDSTIFNPRDYGFDFYGDMLFTSKSYARLHPETVDNFYRATLLGWKYAFAHIDETIAVIQEKYNTLHKSKAALRYEAKMLRKLAYRKGVPLGNIDPVRLREIANTYRLLGINTAIGSDFGDMVYRPSEKYRIPLTAKEQTWLQKREHLNLCVITDRMPLESFDGGKYTGMGADLVKDISTLIDTPLKVRYATSMQDKRCDLFSLIPNHRVQNNLAVTNTLFSFPLVIATRTDKAYLTDLKALKGKKIAFMKGYGLKKYLQTQHPSLQLHEVVNTEAGLRLLETGMVDGYIGLLPIVNYSIGRYHIGTLKINRKMDESIGLGYGVADASSPLLSIVQKAVHALDSERIEEIIHEWTHLKVTDDRVLERYWRWVGMAGILFMLLLYGYLSTARKNKALSLSLRELELLMESTMEGILIFDTNGICLRTNRIASKLFGYMHHEMIGRHASDFITPASREMVREKMKIIDQAPYEARVLRKDGTEFDAIIKGRNIIWKGEQIRVSTIIDISDMKRLQYDLETLNNRLEEQVQQQVEDIRQKDQMLLQQSKLASMGEMIGAIAHQWRQPLNMLNINIQNLDDDYEEGLIDREFIARFIKENSDIIRFMSKTIDDFRNFYRIDKVKECFFVKETIEETLTIQKAQLMHGRIALSVKGEDFCITGYRREFQQVLLNLVNNAADAIRRNRKEGGVIDILLKGERVVVKDNGGGIPEAVLERIFEPYFTTKQQGEGTGIGLYMSKVIIEKNMGGRLEVENSGEGACFTIHMKGLCRLLTKEEAGVLKTVCVKADDKAEVSEAAVV